MWKCTCACYVGRQRPLVATTKVRKPAFITIKMYHEKALSKETKFDKFGLSWPELLTFKERKFGVLP